MALGFKVADAYVSVHTDDDTKPGRDRIERDSEKWSKSVGDKMGLNLGRGLFGHLKTSLGMVKTLFQTAIMGLLKMTMFAAIGNLIAVAIAGLTAAAAKALPILNQLLMTLISAAGVLLLYPAAIMTVVSSLLVFKLGISGVSAAMKALASGDAKALAEALKKLAPAAQQFVLAIKALKPAMDKLKLDVQQRLFTGIAQQIRDLARLWFPTLHSALGGIATQLNGAVRQGLQFLLDVENRSTIAKMFSNIALTIGNVTRAIKPLLSILFNVSTVSTGVLSQLSGGLAAALNRFAAKIDAMSADGSLAKVITDGVASLKILGRSLLDIWGILKGFLGAASAVSQGAGLFSFFSKLNQLVNSIAGQKALQQVFASLNQISKALSPVWGALLQGIGALSVAIGYIAKMSGPDIADLVNGLVKGLLALEPALLAVAPVLGDLGRMILPLLGKGLGNMLAGFIGAGKDILIPLADALKIIADQAGPLGAIFGQVLAAIGPSLGPIAQMLVVLVKALAPGVIDVLQAFGEGLAALAPAAKPVGDALSALMTALAPILPLLGTLLATGLTSLAEILQILAMDAGPLIGILSKLANSFLKVVLAVGIQSFQQMLPMLVTFFEEMATSLQPLIPALTQLGTVILESLVQFMTGPTRDQILSMLGQLTQLFIQFSQQGVKLLVQVLTWLIPQLPTLLHEMMQLSPILLQLVIAAMPFVILLLRLLNALYPLIEQTGLFTVVITLMSASFATVGAAIWWVTNSLNAMAAGAKWLWTNAKKLWEQIGTQWTHASQFFEDLPGKITDRFKGFGTLLLNAGKNLISGLIDGMKSKWNDLTGALGNVGQLIADFFPHSPAKRGPLSGDGDMTKSGKRIGTQLATGIGLGADAVQAAVSALAAMVRLPAVATPGLAGGAGMAAGAAGFGYGGAAVSQNTVNVAPPHITVMIGQKVLDDAVTDVIVNNPGTVSDAANEGDRRNNYHNTGRRRR